MLKILIRLIIFAFFISLSLYVGVQWKLSQDLDYLVSKSGYGARFNYGSSSISPTGEITINDIEITIPSEEIKITIHKAQYKAGSIWDMAFIRTQVNKNEFPKAMSLKLSEVIIPLSPQLVELITKDKVRTTWDAVNASACGKINEIGFKEYAEMGYDFFVFSSDLNFKEDYYSGNLKGYGWFDIEETSRIEFQLDLAGFYEYLDQKDAKTNAPNLEFLDLNIIDKGYNRHRNEFCGLKSGNKSHVYVRKHVKTIAQKLASVGIKMTLTGKKALELSMQPKSEIHIQMRPEISFTLADFGYYDEPEIRKLLGLTIEIDKQLYSSLFDNWALDRFNKIVTREIETKSEQSKNRFFDNVIVKRSFHREETNDINQFINAQVKVVKLNGKTIEGVLQKNESGQFVIDRQIQGGTLTSVIDSKQLKEFYVYR